MARFGEPHGASSLYLAPGIAFLHQEESVFEAMIEGWTMQMLGGRGLRKSSVSRSLATVRQFQKHATEWPWKWTSGLFDEWMTDLVTVRKLAPTTIRTYQYAVRAFCDYLCSQHYGWVTECEERFGEYPTQVCHEENTVRHLQDYEGKPGRRPLKRDELQQLFDHADDEVEARLREGRKGALIAYRDATLLKVLYGWGLRANEAAQLDITDFYKNPHALQFGSYGILQVRFGKASRGGAPKRRAVVSLHQWAVEALVEYIEKIRPLALKSPSNALWLTERGTRLKSRDIADRFALIREALAFDPILTPHALRHSYVTHLIEDGVDPVFVQQQVGHAYQSTTSIYTGVSTDFKNKMMQQALAKMIPNIKGDD